jgi:hypothetical protein
MGRPAFCPKPPPLWRASDALPRLRQLLGVLPDGSPLPAFLPQLGTKEPDSALRASAALSSHPFAKRSARASAASKCERAVRPNAAARAPQSPVLTAGASPHSSASAHKPRSACSAQAAAGVLREAPGRAAWRAFEPRARGLRRNPDLGAGGVNLLCWLQTT